MEFRVWISIEWWLNEWLEDWEKTDYPLLYTMTGNAEPTGLWLRWWQNEFNNLIKFQNFYCLTTLRSLNGTGLTGIREWWEPLQQNYTPLWWDWEFWLSAAPLDDYNKWTTIIYSWMDPSFWLKRPSFVYINPPTQLRSMDGKETFPWKVKNFVFWKLRRSANSTWHFLI